MESKPTATRKPGLVPGTVAIDDDCAGSTHIVIASGEVDIETASELAGALRGVVELGLGPVVIDLSETTFLDSTGLSALLNALRRLTRQGRRLEIVCTQDGPVHRLLAITGLVGTFSVHWSRASALAALATRTDAA